MEIGSDLPVVTVESVDSVLVSSAEALFSFKTTELPKIKLATRTEPAVFHLMIFNGVTFLCLFAMFVCHILDLFLTFEMTLLNTRNLRQDLKKVNLSLK